MAAWPLAAPLGAVMAVLAAQAHAVEALRVAAAVGAVILPNQEMVLALTGLMLLRSGSRMALDGASLGWGLMVASHALAVWTSPQSPFCWALMGTGTFLLGGLWPFSGSWMAHEEGWGRRFGRGLVAIHVLSVALPSVPAPMEAWAPWAVFVPGVGVLWCAALVLSPAGQRCGLALLWFFELHMLALVCLGTKGAASMGVLVWGAVLPALLMHALASSRPGSSRPQGGTRIVAYLALASVLAVPGAVGFAARFSSISSLLSSSPAGLACYVIGVLLVPAFLRPIREELRNAACPPSTFIVCGAAGAMILVLGIAPGLGTRSEVGVWLWRFLLR